MRTVSVLLKASGLIEKQNKTFPAKDNFFNTPKKYPDFLYQIAGMLKFSTSSHLKKLSPLILIL